VAAGHEPAENAISFLRPFFLWFDRTFFSIRDRYIRLVGHSLSRKFRYLAVFVLIVVAMGFLFLRMPTAYLPDEDQGILMVQALLPANSTLEQTDKVMKDVRDYILGKEKDSVESIMTISGVNSFRPGPNPGLASRQDEGLGSPKPAGSESKRGGGKGHGGIFPDAQCDGLCLRTTGGYRTGYIKGV
jgi:HAE1 family hydrophobic/amphiphilic exporter-1